MVRVVDLFSGCGGISLGVQEACRALGLGFEHALAIDVDKSASLVFAANFGSENLRTGSVNDYFEPLEAKLSAGERLLQTSIGQVDLLVGGPPCQGHSDLNNYTRRNDPKNALYQTMARAARILQPKAVLVENVQGSRHDVSGTVELTRRVLEAEGYHVEDELVNLLSLGVPQRRRRHIMIATRGRAIRPSDIEAKYRIDSKTVRWAIADLAQAEPKDLVNIASRPSKDNQRRIQYLFDNELFELPNSERPPCHRDKAQTYHSVYGRLRWDDSAQTITSGFYSMCMGRYVHPSLPRTLTAHEAARLQFFPDFFDFAPAGNRTSLATIIGNAVPMKLSYVAAGEILGAMETNE